jgi:hypothetical protein
VDICMGVYIYRVPCTNHEVCRMSYVVCRMTYELRTYEHTVSSSFKNEHNNEHNNEHTILEVSNIPYDI